MSGVPPFFSHAFSSKVLCIIVYTLDIWLALVHVMHCMALVHHVHGLPTLFNDLTRDSIANTFVIDVY